MEPQVRRAAVAPVRGYLREAPVRAGDRVARGQLLAALDDRELRLERAKWESQRAQIARQRSAALAQLNAAQVGIAAAQIDQATAHIDLIDDQVGKMRVQSDVDGIVVSGDLSQSLGSPIEKGQLLFEIAPLDAYRLVLQVDERDVGTVAVGQRGQVVLTAAPADGIGFTVKQITPVSTALEGRNYFRVEAVLDVNPAGLRPGLEGVAKVQTGRGRLVELWTRPAIDWLRLAAWSWTP
jgi:multidrug resistance efflux pump